MMDLQLRRYYMHAVVGYLMRDDQVIFGIDGIMTMAMPNKPTFAFDSPLVSRTHLPRLKIGRVTLLRH
jgi:hypothetical protein